MRKRFRYKSEFPPLSQATAEGLLAVGGDLSAERLIDAYSRGIFPWYNPGQPIMWWSPDPRAVLFPEDLITRRSLRKVLRQRRFQIKMDTAFEQVVDGCAEPRGDDHQASWITDEMKSAYMQLHRLRLAHSVEAWCEGRLAGGLYGVAMGGVFFGESMFSRTANASKCALVGLVRYLQTYRYKAIDCQIESNHLVSLGACLIPRNDFVSLIGSGVEYQPQCDEWRPLSVYPE